MMLSGIVKKNIDKKGRIAIPKRFRDNLADAGNGRLAAIFLDGCLQIYPWVFWEQIKQAILALPPLDPDSRALQRIWGSIVEISELDNEGRVILSKEIREQAGIKDEVMLVGAINRLEIWASDIWQKQSELLPSAEEVGRHLTVKFSPVGGAHG